MKKTAGGILLGSSLILTAVCCVTMVIFLPGLEQQSVKGTWMTEKKCSSVFVNLYLDRVQTSGVFVGFGCVRVRLKLL